MPEKNFKDVARDVLKDNALTNALDFAAFLDLNGMPPQKAGETLWQVSHKDKCVCYIHIDGAAEMPGPWTVWPDGSYADTPDGFPMDEPTKETARAHINICGSCGAPCSPGKPATIFGKKFENVCNSVMAFNNPDSAALECLKKLTEARKCAIDTEV